MEEENLRRNIPSRDRCRIELTPTNSDDYSGLTFDTSKRLNVNEDPSTVWTNEKHRLYLDSLEASFVNQLHHSIDLHDCLQDIISSGPYSSRHLPTNVDYSLHQFKVLQDGYRKKIDFEKNEPLLESTTDSQFSHEIVSSHELQVHNVPCTKGIHIGSFSVVSCGGSARSSEQRNAFHLHHCPQDSIGSTIEFSDQNFVDEDQGEMSSCEFRTKRLKI